MSVCRGLVAVWDESEIVALDRDPVKKDLNADYDMGLNIWSQHFEYYIMKLWVNEIWILHPCKQQNVKVCWNEYHLIIINENEI